MKTIFLDIDGVLHPFSSESTHFFCWAPLLVAVLGTSEVQIVIHSTWRLRYSLEAIRGQFPESIRARISGCIEGMGRFEGICQYVETRAITDFLVLDDLADFFPPDWPHLLLCAGETGISDPGVQVKLRAFLVEPGH